MSVFVCDPKQLLHLRLSVLRTTSIFTPCVELPYDEGGGGGGDETARRKWRQPVLSEVLNLIKSKVKIGVQNISFAGYSVLYIKKYQT